MNVIDSYKLMEIYAVCPKCGCDRIGGGSMSADQAFADLV